MRSIRYVSVVTVVLACGCLRLLADESAADHYNRGGRLYNEGKYDEAIQAYTEGMKLLPTHGQLYEARGDAYLAMGNKLQGEGKGTEATNAYGKATADLVKAVELNKSLVTAWRSCGVAYQKLHEHELAVKSFSEALKRHPRFDDALYYRSLSYRALGKPELAKQDYEKLREVSPSRAETLLKLIEE